MPGDASPIPVTVYLTPAFKKKLDRVCRTNGYTITGFMRIAAEQRLAAIESPFDTESLSKAVSRS